MKVKSMVMIRVKLQSGKSQAVIWRLTAPGTSGCLGPNAFGAGEKMKNEKRVGEKK